MGMTAGVAVAGRGAGAPKADPAAQAERELAAAGLTHPSESEPELATSCHELSTTTGVDALVAREPFRMTLANGPVEGDVLPPLQARSAMNVLRRELGRYSIDRLRTAGLRRVVLVSELRESGKLISSLPNVAGSLLVDGSVPEAFLPRLIHHEVFHFMDFADEERSHENDAWKAENGLFLYGEGGRSVRSSRASELTDEAPGFLTRYAMTAVEEDKAEVFSLLMTKHAEVSARAAKDQVVRAKIDAVMTKLGRVAPELRPLVTL